MTGLEVARRIRVETRNALAPIVVVSLSSGGGIASVVPISAVLRKPITSTAHRLSGGCAVIGAWHMVALCAELARETPMADEQVAGLVERLGRELERVRLEIDDLRRAGWQPRGA